MHNSKTTKLHLSHRRPILNPFICHDEFDYYNNSLSSIITFNNVLITDQFISRSKSARVELTTGGTVFC